MSFSVLDAGTGTPQRDSVGNVHLHRTSPRFPSLATSPALRASWDRQLFPITLFIFIYCLYLLLFTDYCWLVRQLKMLEEAGVCWMVGLMLQCRPTSSLLRARRDSCPGGVQGGPGGRCFCCWSFTPEPDSAGERLCDCKRLKLCPCVYFSWLPHCIITCQHFRWGFICALKIAWGGRMQTLCSMLENVPPA